MNIFTRFSALVVATLVLWNCAGQSPTASEPQRPGPHGEEVSQYGDRHPAQEAEHVLTGLDVLLSMNFEPLQGKAVGVITNHTAVSRSGEHLVDLLHTAPQVTLRAIFAPEHGFRGDSQGGDAIPGGVDSATGVPIYSLYGAQHMPTAEMLDGIDVLVFDIQDVGARFYTYISTMGYVLEAGAANQLPVMILDRPNPIGRRADGNVLDEGYESFVGRYKIPIQYGLTMGELARMIIGEHLIPDLGDVELHVVACEGWSGEAVWSQTDLTWLPPSPNMRNTNETLTYPGLCLLEGVRISEGRGTSYPFEYIGAPYMDGKRLARQLLQADLEGFTVEPVDYVPVDLPGVAMNPIFEGETVHGVKVTVTDPARFKAVDFLLNLLVITKRDYPQDFGWRGSRGPDRLWGGPELREMVDAGRSVAEIQATYADEVQEFLRLREKYIIYR